MAADVLKLDGRRSIGNVKRLLQSLVPRAQCFCFYDMDRHCAWSSDGADDYELDNFVADLPEEIIDGSEADGQFLRRTLPSGRTVLLLSVLEERRRGLGVLVAVFSRNAGKSSWFNPSLLRKILLPVIDVIRDNVLAARRIERAEQRAATAEQELKLVYQLDEKVLGGSRSNSSLARLVGQSGRHLDVAYSTLLMPAKRIRISAAHASWKAVDRKSLETWVLDELYPTLKGRREPLIREVAPAAAPGGSSQQGCEALLCPMLDEAGNVEGVLAQLGRVDGRPFDPADTRFMSHIVRQLRHVIARSFDTMTGLMNRAGFEAQAAESLGMPAADGRAHRLIYLDLDNLHLVNDTFGQDAGDDVIARFAQTLDELLPMGAVAGRLAGDDFAVLLTHSREEKALAFADRLRDAARQLRYLHGDRSLQVTVSAGLAAFDPADDEVSDLIRAARIACIAAKDHGRDRLEVYDSGNQSMIRRVDDMHLVSEIRRALDTNAFELLAQPVVSLEDADAAPRYEILLRMCNGAGEHVPSELLFPAAERYQLMPQIDRWVVSASLSFLAAHAEALAASGAEFAINLSGQSLGDDDIRRFIDEEIDAAGVPAGALCFDVTESAAVANRSKAQAFIDSLRERGCRFSLDNFGAGLSSFAYLKSFRVDTLKIDGSFVRDITDNRISESMVAAITQVARVLELETVAEHVETEGAKALLAELGVDYAQGHALGRPLPLTDVLAELGAAPAASRA